MFLNTKFVLSFDPLDFAPTSGERQAYYGNLESSKMSLEITYAKDDTLIHENAHISYH